MKNALTPSKVLEEYDIVGAKIPTNLITEMREKFASLEMEDVGIWKILCDEVADIDVEQEIDQQKLYVAQACAEVLSERINYLNYLDGFSWRQRVCQIENQQGFINLFKLLNIENQDWQNSTWLINNGFEGLYSAITDDKRFNNSWTDFKKFMNVYEKTDVEKIAECNTPDDYLAFFKESGIKGNNWQSVDWLQQNNFCGIYKAIRKKFVKWKIFIDFMSIPRVIVYKRTRTRTPRYEKEVANCSTPNDYLALFKELGIQGDNWKNSKWLRNNGYQTLYKAIKNYFISWENFKKFMNIYEKTDVEKIAECDTPDDFLTLFKELGIKGDNWKNSKLFGVHNLWGIELAIKKRFTTWSIFLMFMDPSSIREDEELDKISGISLEDSIALLAEKDPHKLKLYIQFAHPELAEEEVDKLVIRAFKNFVAGRSETRESKYLEYPISLPSDTVDHPTETDEASVILEGKATGEFVYITGVYPRKVRIVDGSFSVAIPLKQGKLNEVRILAVDTTDPENNSRSEQQTICIRQTAEEQDDVAVLFALLDSHSVSLRQNIRKNPGRAEYLQQCAEQVLIKKFSRSFEEGEEYVEDLLQQTESPSVIKVLKNVLKKFRKVHSAPLKNVQDGSLMFFQKYCAYEIQRRMHDENCPGVILANDPGLGKTRTIEAAVADREAGIICPNAVVSAWEEEANIVLQDPDLLVMRDTHHEIRKNMLRTRKQIADTISPRRYVTNTNFLQNTKDTERFALLGDPNMVIVHDEAHSRINEHSEQSKGARMIEHAFQINVTATPAKNPEAARRLLRTLYPKDKRFQSAAAFKKVFPSNDTRALKTLSLLLQKDMIRFRKQDVLELIDPEQSLLQQKHKLPRKEYISNDKFGTFTKSEKQAVAIYEMFLNWHKWTKKYDKYIPKDDTSEEDRLRVAGALTKKHALRQSINNPEYLGIKGVDSKAQQVKKIVNDCLQRGRKVVIFCAYNAQAKKYADMFKKHNPALYTGETSNQGDYKNANGDIARFQRESETHKRKRGWKFDADGYPIEDPQGDTMSALDYERLTFQNAEDRKINIVTYKAGAVGTTFTAGKAMIFDDLPTDVIEAIQAEDRIQRIDPDRQSHATVEYYNVISKYPKKFLSKMKKVWVVRDRTTQSYKEYKTRDAAERFANAQAKKLGHDAEIHVDTAFNMFFDQGTYDEVHAQNLVTQRHMFHLINDGIADAAILKEDQIQFKGFENGDNATEVV